MSDCDQCVHTYKSGNCLLGHNQTSTTIDNRVVNSSLEPDCPYFVLGYCVRDSGDCVRDSSDSVRDSSTKFEILRGVNHGLVGGYTASACFFILDTVPSLDCITLFFCVIFLISAAIYAFDSPEDNDQDQDGDDK